MASPCCTSILSLHYKHRARSFQLLAATRVLKQSAYSAVIEDPWNRHISSSPSSFRPDEWSNTFLNRVVNNSYIHTYMYLLALTFPDFSIPLQCFAITTMVILGRSEFGTKELLFDGWNTVILVIYNHNIVKTYRYTNCEVISRLRKMDVW